MNKNSEQQNFEETNPKVVREIQTFNKTEKME